MNKEVNYLTTVLTYDIDSNGDPNIYTFIKDNLVEKKVMY